MWEQNDETHTYLRMLVYIKYLCIHCQFNMYIYTCTQAHVETQKETDNLILFQKL